MGQITPFAIVLLDQLNLPLMPPVFQLLLARDGFCGEANSSTCTRVRTRDFLTNSERGDADWSLIRLSVMPM